MARTRFPVTNTKAEISGVVPDEEASKTVTLGYGIERIFYERPEQAGGAWDYKATLEGRVRPSVPRPGDEDVLPRGGVLGLVDAVRLHLWGPILGNSTPAGLADGSAELNRRQLETIEMVRGKRYPFLQAAVYEITFDDGSFHAFELGIDAEGEVYGPVSRVAGSG